jgi:hypothetical protein
MSSTAPRLPEEFRDLERFSDWSLATERERQYKRLASEMSELHEFYGAMLPRVEEIVSYLNQFPLDALPDEARHLLNLCLSVVEVSNAVEMFGQPAVIDGFDAERFVPIE